MALTLDEYLAEVDRWKQAAQDELAPLSDAERADRLQAVRRLIESRMQQPLRETPQPERLTQ